MGFLLYNDNDGYLSQLTQSQFKNAQSYHHNIAEYNRHFSHFYTKQELFVVQSSASFL